MSYISKKSAPHYWIRTKNDGIRLYTDLSITFKHRRTKIDVLKEYKFETCEVDELLVGNIVNISYTSVHTGIPFFASIININRTPPTGAIEVSMSILETALLPLSD